MFLNEANLSWFFDLLDGLTILLGNKLIFILDYKP